MKHTNTVKEGNAFTGGEWEAKQITKKQIIIGIKGYGEGDNYRKDNSCGQIAQIHGWDGNKSADLSSEDFANARLISESKNMYELLNEMVNEYKITGNISVNCLAECMAICSRINNQ